MAGTSHYNITKLTETNPINIVTDVNTPLDQIDSAIYNATEAAKTDASGKVSTLEQQMNGRMTSMERRFDDYYTKSEAGTRFEPKHEKGIIGCVGDSILAGWSDEHPRNIDSWDFYLAQALGYEASDVYKDAIGGAGFASGTTFEQEIGKLKTTITKAGHNVNEVDYIIIGGGVNDIINKRSAAECRTGCINAVRAAKNAFPRAEVHVFPMIIGTRGLNALMMEVEAAVVEGALTLGDRVVTHTGVWSWNYDGNDAGVSADRVHLLAGGLKRVGDSMACEIRGGSAYRQGYSYKITDALGGHVATGYRRDNMFFFKLAANVTSGGAEKVALAVDIRYGVENWCFTVTDNTASKNLLFFYNTTQGAFTSLNQISAQPCYGCVAYPILSTFSYG